MNELTIITTSDGSHSLLNTQLNETYHSTHGAVQESIHVFLKNGFDFLLEENKLTQVNILEIGFGTGLNVLLTLYRGASLKIPIAYTSLEAFPITVEVARQLNYPETLSMPDAVEKFDSLHHAAWNAKTKIQPDFNLIKLHAKLEDAQLETERFDLVYYDAFAPSKQPEMWDIAMLGKVINTMTTGGVFVTYCAKGQLKRDLKSLGLQVETLAGPPGKKEMVRAVKGQQ